MIDSTHEVTPIDHGDVCLNVDKKWFASRGIAPPKALAELTEPRYRKLLVVENRHLDAGARVHARDRRPRW